MSGSFEPIAIVGRACVLPGALSPEALFDAVRDARVLIDEAPDGAWGLDSRRLVHEGAHTFDLQGRAISPSQRK